MKKILSALCIIAICLCSCNNNITNPEVDEPKNENSAFEECNCLLNISVDNTDDHYPYEYSSDDYLVLNTLIIKDENGKVVGTGAYWEGSYYVPYGGTLTINWRHRGDYYDTFVNSEYTFEVKSAHQLDLVVRNSQHFCEIKVGRSVIASFDH